MSGADLDALVAFAEAVPLGDYPPGLPRQLMAELSRGPDGVWDLRAGDARLLAVLVERVQVADGAAILELLAGSGLEAPGARRALLGLALARLEGLLGRSRPVHLPLPPAWRDLDDILKSNDFMFNHLICEMERPEGLPAPAHPELPAGLAWVEAGEGTYEGYYEALKRAFAGRPDVAFADFEAWKDMVRASPITPRLLLREGRVLGFVNVARTGPGVGQVRSIGRAPAFKGAGLGPILLGEALALLHEAGATRFTLSVLATNAAALRLYRDAGFEVQTEVRVFVRPAAPS